MIDISFLLKMIPKELQGIVSVIKKSAEKENATIMVIKKGGKIMTIETAPDERNENLFLNRAAILHKETTKTKKDDEKEK